ncbi:MAG: enolase C-terminal domain-like protein [Bryobacterales bacterium]
MRIRAIHNAVVPIASEIRNAYISFAKMTVSVVAIVSDVERDGKPLVGYGFNSNGRYDQQGLLSRRFIPRLMDADPKALLDDERDNFDPHKAWKAMMADEKPGGHGERSVAVGVLDMALWDLVAKIEGKPLYRLLAERYRGGKADESVWVYAAGGYYYPGKDIPQLVAEMQRYVAMGYEAVKIKIGGAPLAEDLERIEAVLEAIGPSRRLAVDANGRFDRATALAYAEALSAYPLLWYEEAGDPLDYALNAEVAAASKVPVATGENLFSMQDARNLLRHGGMLRESWTTNGPGAELRPGRILADTRRARSRGLVAAPLRPPRRTPIRAALGRGAEPGRERVLSGVFEPFGGFADGVPVENGRVKLPDAPGIGIEAKQSLRGCMSD